LKLDPAKRFGLTPQVYIIFGLSSPKTPLPLKLSEFKFELPSSLIAAQPLPNRDDSRMMVINRKTQTIEHRQFRDILDLFGEGDSLVLNNSKVFRARMYGNKEKTGAMIEVFLLRELNASMRMWDALVDPARKIRVGNKLYFGENDELIAEVVDNTTSRGRTIRFIFDGDDEGYRKALTTFGETPLPKEMGRDVQPEDEERYQTIFAKRIGAVAAPTAGMHFSRAVLKRMELKGIETPEITLHVGLGVFKPVEVEDLTKHKPESEFFEVDETAAQVINRSLMNNHRVCAVGTTTLRALEASMSAGRKVKPTTGWTDKFMFPPHNFLLADSLLTNFQLPESTSLMIASSFAGQEFLREVYRVAISEKYRFFAYGDALLIL
jgi:S-adenosylmethionine:tRNA ribosyltransferase-isomerase